MSTTHIYTHVDTHVYTHPYTHAYTQVYTRDRSSTVQPTSYILVCVKAHVSTHAIDLSTYTSIHVSRNVSIFSIHMPRNMSILSGSWRQVGRSLVVILVNPSVADTWRVSMGVCWWEMRWSVSVRERQLTVIAFRRSQSP